MHNAQAQPTETVKIQRMNCCNRHALIIATFFAALLPALSAHSAETQAERVGACPANFNAFLDRFAIDAGFRAQHIEYPLTYLRPRRDKVQAMRVTPAVKSHYPGASFPSDKEQAAMPLDRHITATASGTYTVTLRKDARYDRTFVFRQTPGCWCLIQVRNAVPL